MSSIKDESVADFDAMSITFPSLAAGSSTGECESGLGAVCQKDSVRQQQRLCQNLELNVFKIQIRRQ